MTLQTDMSPSDDYFAITPSDTVDLPKPIRALGVAVGGTVKVTKPNGAQDTLTLPAGVFPMKVVRIWAGGTAATGLTGFV